jgi:hypothetical protein
MNRPFGVRFGSAEYFSPGAAGGTTGPGTAHHPRYPS